MQTIFYNARIMTLNKKEPSAEAMLVNDGSIVFVGEKDEVLNLKQDDTVLVDLENKIVMPSFFDVNCQVYDLIEERLKTAKKFKYLEMYDEKDENFENFANFEVYKEEFLKIQEELLSLGITTIQEMNIAQAEFIFWKKMVDTKLLKIDVIGYVDMLTAKVVMDNNCISYRKYKNGFRLGGYSLKLDGDLIKKRAWLKKPYKREGKYLGYAEIFDEQLTYLIKTALEEKKQIVVDASGDRAVEQFLTVFEDVVNREKIEDKFRPVILNSQMLSKKNIEKMKELEIVPSFQVEDVVKNEKQLICAVGKNRAKKCQPYNLMKKHNVDFLIQSGSLVHFDFFENLKMLMTKSKLHKKASILTVQEALDSMIITASNKAFDGEQKGTFETGKTADFLVVDSVGELFDDAKIISVYKQGEKIK